MFRSSDFRLISLRAFTAVKPLLDDQKMGVKQVWGDRGLASKVNSAMLKRREIGDGFCPRNVANYQPNSQVKKASALDSSGGPPPKRG